MDWYAYFGKAGTLAIFSNHRFCNFLIMNPKNKIKSKHQPLPTGVWHPAPTISLYNGYILWCPDTGIGTAKDRYLSILYIKNKIYDTTWYAAYFKIFKYFKSILLARATCYLLFIGVKARLKPFAYSFFSSFLLGINSSLVLECKIKIPTGGQGNEKKKPSEITNLDLNKMPTWNKRFMLHKPLSTIGSNEMHAILPICQCHPAEKGKEKKRKKEARSVWIPSFLFKSLSLISPRNQKLWSEGPRGGTIWARWWERPAKRMGASRWCTIRYLCTSAQRCSRRLIASSSSHWIWRGRISAPILMWAMPLTYLRFHCMRALASKMHRPLTRSNTGNDHFRYSYCDGSWTQTRGWAITANELPWFWIH